MLKKLIFGMIVLLLVTSNLFAGGTVQISLAGIYPSQMPVREELYFYNKLGKKSLIWNGTPSRLAYATRTSVSGRYEPENNKNISGTDFYVCNAYNSPNSRFMEKDLTLIGEARSYNDTLNVTVENGKTYYVKFVWYLNPKLEAEDYYAIYNIDTKIVCDQNGTVYVYFNSDSGDFPSGIKTATNLNVYGIKNGAELSTFLE